MKKVKIKVITIGHLPLHLNLKKVIAWNSSIFEISGEIENYSLRCDSDSYGWEFSDELIKAQLETKFDGDFLLAIVNVPIESNWYSRRLGDNQIVFTFNQIKDVLNQENIPLENAILRVLYSYTLLYKRAGNKIPSAHEAPSFAHDETRGCLFDMNGIKTDLVESCDVPIICEECQERLRKDRVSIEMIDIAKNEIKNIKKDLYFRVIDYIKIHPVISFIISTMFALSIGIAGSIMASYIYEAIQVKTVTKNLSK